MKNSICIKHLKIKCNHKFFYLYFALNFLFLCLQNILVTYSPLNIEQIIYEIENLTAFNLQLK